MYVKGHGRCLGVTYEKGVARINATQPKHIALALTSIIFALATPLAQAQTVRAEVLASNLQNPWAMAFLPDGRFLVTERPGRLRVIEPNGEISQPVLGLPGMVAQGQGGLLDVLVDTDFVNNNTFWFSGFNFL